MGMGVGFSEDVGSSRGVKAPTSRLSHQFAWKGIQQSNQSICGRYNLFGLYLRFVNSTFEGRKVSDNFYDILMSQEYSMPFNEENQYLFSGKTQFEQAVDFYICSWSDVFVPTVPGVFYAHVSGERITEGLNHILVPALKNKPGSTKLQVSGAISPYVEKKSHPVYTCYCEPPSKAAAKRSQGPFALSEATVSKLSTSAGKREGRSKKSDKDVVL